jgi:hypothetical protein
MFGVELTAEGEAHARALLAPGELCAGPVFFGLRLARAE